MRILLMAVPMMAVAALIIAIITFGNIAMSNAQQLPSQLISAQGGNMTFQSINDSFSISVPEGWVIQDVSSADTATLLSEMLEGYRILAELCPQEQAPPDTGDRYSCEDAQDHIYIKRYPSLARDPESPSVSNNSLTNEQFLIYITQKLEESGYSDITVVNNTDMTINVTSSDTNETIATVPAKLVEMTYSVNSTETRGYSLLSATNATSNLGLISGYSISYEGALPTTQSGNPPVAVKEVFQSFEFVKEEGEEEVAAPGNITKIPL
jgi:hypothetical protein